MANFGPKLFSKKLTDTDIKHRLYWPSSESHLLPAFDGTHVHFLVKDLCGNLWPFSGISRPKGRDQEIVISSGWKQFVKSKDTKVKAGDEVIFYQSEDPNEALFAVTIKPNVRVFGNNLNDAEK